MISENRVAVLWAAPTGFRAIKREDPEGKYVGAYDLSCLRTLFLAGERSDPDTIAWAERMLGVPVIDHWWQTETSWSITGNLVGLGLLPVKPGSAHVPLPGYDVQVVDAAAHPVATGQMGSLVVKLPLPSGCLPTLWQHDAEMVESYLREFPGFYKSGDAGHRLSTGGMEEVLSSHQDVAECAVIGIKDDLKGEVACGFVVLKAGVDREPDTLTSMNNLAECMRALGDAANALPLFQRTLESRQLVLGAEHPETLTGVNNLAECMRALGDAAGAFTALPSDAGEPNAHPRSGALGNPQHHEQSSRVYACARRCGRSLASQPPSAGEPRACAGRGASAHAEHRQQSSELPFGAWRRGWGLATLPPDAREPRTRTWRGASGRL